MTRPQHSDRFSLDETLAAMERLGRPGEYRQGYEDGFDNDEPAVYVRDSEQQVTYGCGYIAGTRARERGAHGGEAS